jgi:hypothetical protein
MVTRRTLRNDELDIWDEGMRKQKNNQKQLWGVLERVHGSYRIGSMVMYQV